MILRATTVVVLLTASVIALTGCLGSTPEPAPTTTAVFSSEEEAFAVAEETYRAYIDAVNARYADPASDPDPQSFLVGSALEDDLEAIRSFEELGIRIVGESSIVHIAAVVADPVTGDAQIDVCLDSSRTRVVNASGQDVTMPDRDPRTSLRVDLVVLGDPMLIERSVTSESDEC